MSKVLVSYSNKFWSKENNWLLKMKYMLKLYKKVTDEGQTEIVCFCTVSYFAIVVLVALFLLIFDVTLLWSSDLAS